MFYKKKYINMLNVNKVIIGGYVGSVEIKYTSSGDPVLNMSVATNKKWTDKDGNKSTSTEWHRVVVFGKLAALVKDWIKQGSAVYAEGELRTRKWQDENSTNRWTTEIVLSGYSSVLQVLDKKVLTPKNFAPVIDNADADAAAAQEPEDDIPF